MQSCRVLSRALSTTVRRPATQRMTFEKVGAHGEVPNTPGYKKVMDLQKLMCVSLHNLFPLLCTGGFLHLLSEAQLSNSCADDGLLVWQKRGSRDALPYYGSMALMFAGIGYAFYQIFRMSVPKKQ